MKIYNTMTNKKEEFKPLEKGKIKMYVCGPTVYNYFHIGNARPFLFFDVVRRYFEFIGYDVTFVQNITDIDDKLIEQSIKENVPVSEIAKKYIKAFYEDIEKLEIRRVDIQPKATEYIGKMIKLIKSLEEKGYAYRAGGDVYFSVEKFKDYGKLSGRKLKDMKAGARVEKNDNKKNPFDFTLWKAAKPNEPKWKSPWGEGRPGWHTECVVMSQSLLGETFDIHGGGIDLVFPHHENEIAQAESLTGKVFVRYWMHNGYLNIEGQKMSKSLNNFFTARDILKKYKPEAIRFFFLSKHYRSPIDFSESIIIESQKAVTNFYEAFKDIDFLSFKNEKMGNDEKLEKIKSEFKTAMDDDFNTAKAISVLFELSKIIKNTQMSLEFRKKAALLMYQLGSVLGFFKDIEKKLQNDINNLSEKLIELLIDYRNNFKKEKNWEMADKIRNDLASIGIELKDTKEGTKWSQKSD